MVILIKLLVIFPGHESELGSSCTRPGYVFLNVRSCAPDRKAISYSGINFNYPNIKKTPNFDNICQN